MEQHLHLVLHNLSEGKLGQSKLCKYYWEWNCRDSQPLCVTQVGSIELSLSSETYNCVLVSYFLLRWSPRHCTRPETVPPTWDMLEISTPKCNVKLGSGCSINNAVAGFCNQMDQQESVQFWPVLLLCASIGKANTLSETWGGCNRFFSSSYVLCNRDRLISELHPVQAIWLQ